MDMYVQRRNAHALAAYESYAPSNVDGVVVVGHLGGIRPHRYPCSMQSWTALDANLVEKLGFELFTPLILMFNFLSRVAFPLDGVVTKALPRMLTLLFPKSLIAKSSLDGRHFRSSL